MHSLDDCLRASAAHHHRLCPLQVLGARIGLLAGRLLDLDLPRRDKRLLAILETDGCFVDGVVAATGCAPGRRTLRIEDYGKVAATFVDVETGEAFRIRPHPLARQRAQLAVPHAASRWEAQLFGYRQMDDSLLLESQSVELDVSLSRWISRPGARVGCHGCGEEIINERELFRDGVVLCRACVGEAYYRATLPLAAEGGGASVRPPAAGLPSHTTSLPRLEPSPRPA